MASINVYRSLRHRRLKAYFNRLWNILEGLLVLCGWYIIYVVGRKVPGVMRFK